MRIQDGPTASSTSQVQPKVINISKRRLIFAQVSLLSKGPNFCPTTKGNFLAVKADVKEFTRKLKMVEKIHNVTFNDSSLIKERSNYDPKDGNKDLTKIIEAIENIDPTPTKSTENLTREERKTLKGLVSYDDITIKKSDKGDALVIMDSAYYKFKLVFSRSLTN